MIDSVKGLVSRIDIRRLSGVRSVLGIALEPGGAHVVELRRRGNPLDSLAGKIEAVKIFTCSLRGKNAVKSGIALKNAFSDFGICAKFSVISPIGARYVSTILPSEVDNSHEWVQENAAKLLHLPVLSSEILFSIDKTESTPSGQRSLITFLRRGEVESCVQIAGSAGLELISISPGLQDLIPVCALATGEAPPAYQIVHSEQGSLTTLSCENGRLRDVKTEYTATGLSFHEILERTSPDQGGQPLKVFVSGAFEKSGGKDAVIRPFGLTSDFAIAAGLALKGLLPRSGPADFLPQKERDGFDLNLAKQLLRRTILTSGLLLLFVLGVPLALSAYFAVKLDESSSVAESGAAEIETLQKEASLLRESSRGCDAPGSRSNSAFLLHEIARLTPKSIRLVSLVLHADGPGFRLRSSSQSTILSRVLSTFHKLTSVLLEYCYASVSFREKSQGVNTLQRYFPPFDFF